MDIRVATEGDLPRILGLGKEFGHLMLYQKAPDMMKRYLPRILVAEQDREVVGYFHYIVSGDPGFVEMLRCYRQMPEEILREASSYPRGELCSNMQGASHREVFQEFIRFLQARYPRMWCYISVKSRRRESMEMLGFTFDPEEVYTFWNCSKGDYSTYQLGRWKGDVLLRG